MNEVGSKMEPYSYKHMKFRMVEKFGHELTINPSEGRSCVVTLQCNLEHVMNTFHQKCTDSETKGSVEDESKMIVVTAAGLIKAEINKYRKGQRILPI